MKPHKHLKLFVILILASCSGLRNTPQLREISKGNTDSSASESTTQPDLKYSNLLGLVEQMKELLEKENKMPLFAIEKVSENERKRLLQLLEETHKKQRKFIDTLYEKTFKLLNGDENIDNYLNYLLTIRLVCLNNRDEHIQQTLGNLSPQEITILPTSEKLFDLVMQGQDREFIDLNKLFRLYAIEKFELLNLLIEESFASCSLDELEPDTINLLRASVQLHPILTGERKDLEHPDVIGWYALLEDIVMSFLHKTGSRSNQGAKLAELINAKEAFSIAKNYPQGQVYLAFLKLLYNRICTILKQGNNPAVSQIILDCFWKKCDTKVCDGHTPKPQSFRLKNLGTPTGPQHTITGELTDFEVDKWPYPLPEPDFLNPNLRKANKAIQQESPLEESLCAKDKTPVSVLHKLLDHTVDGKTTEVAEPTPATQEAPVVKNMDLPEPKPFITEAGLGKALSELINFPEGKVEKEIGGTRLTSKKSPKAKQLEKAAQLESNKPTPVSKVPLGQWVPPRGIRLFHDLMPLSAGTSVELPNNKQEIVDRLFDPAQQCHVTFSQFRSVWEATGGRIHGNHGSHRFLKDAHGTTIGGLFMRGRDNQTYGPKSVAYLQAALLYIGVRPTRYQEKAQ